MASNMGNDEEEENTRHMCSLKSDETDFKIKLRKYQR